MATKNYRRSTKTGRTYKKSGAKRTSKRKTSKSSELTSFAYKMGQVQRGLQNPDSKISSSFERGKMKPEKRQKQTLF